MLIIHEPFGHRFPHTCGKLRRIQDQAGCTGSYLDDQYENELQIICPAERVVTGIIQVAEYGKVPKMPGRVVT